MGTHNNPIELSESAFFDQGSDWSHRQNLESHGGMTDRI